MCEIDWVEFKMQFEAWLHKLTIVPLFCFLRFISGPEHDTNERNTDRGCQKNHSELEPCHNLKAETICQVVSLLSGFALHHVEMPQLPT